MKYVTVHAPNVVPSRNFSACPVLDQSNPGNSELSALQMTSCIISFPDIIVGLSERTFPSFTDGGTSKTLRAVLNKTRSDVISRKMFYSLCVCVCFCVIFLFSA